jgi:hypothetical protein
VELIMVDHIDNDDHFQGSISLSYKLFKDLKCVIDDPFEVDEDGKENLLLMDEDRIRGHILDCLVALRRVQKAKRIIKTSMANKQYEIVEQRVFASAVSTIMDDGECSDARHSILTSLLAPFPDNEKMTDGRSWLPLHIAIGLGDEVKVEDVHKIYLHKPLVMHRYSFTENQIETGFLPAHFLCMQTQPNMSLMRYLSMRDMKSFTISVYEGESYLGGRNALQLAAEYSGSVELVNDTEKRWR